MKRLMILAPLLLSAAACNTNSAPGADREAEGAPPPTAAPVRSASDALANLSPGILAPETMSRADLAALGSGARCRFLMTEVAFPSFAMDPDGFGYLKLNGSLVRIPRAGAERWADAGLIVQLRDVPGESGDAGLPAQEMLIALPGAKDELGYRGYSRC